MFIPKINMYNIYLASKQDVKIKAVQHAMGSEWIVVPCECKSGVSEQPFGMEEIRRGAFNRLKNMRAASVALETGIVRDRECYVDITCCLLQTRFGLFESWSQPVCIPSKYMTKWLALENRKNVTIGSLIYEDNKYVASSANDWYNVISHGSWSDENLTLPRLVVMANCVKDAVNYWKCAQDSMPRPVIPAKCVEFNGVPFLDIQGPLVDSPRDLMLTVRRLADRLLFDTVVVLDARGFLLASQFAIENYPIVMARKKGKLPSEEWSVEYQKEYGTDTLCLTKGAIKHGSKVIIVDDVIATGGSMLAVEKLVELSGASVVAFIAPYAIKGSDKLLCPDSIRGRLRFLCTQKEAVCNKTTVIPVNVMSVMQRIFITPPSLASLSVGYPQMPVTWNKFEYSSNIWFDASVLENKNVYLLLNTSDPREMNDVIQLLKILYRKKYKSLTVVIPFLEQSTQDRVEHKGKMESLALVDTVSKMIGKHKVLTFDLHAEQSRFSFYDLEFKSLVAILWETYHLSYPDSIPVFPDDGSHKRFGKLPDVNNEMVFRKKRNGAERIISTDDGVTGKHYVIIDDLVRSGGTMNSVAKYLLSHGAEKVDALFAHAPFERAAATNLSIFNDVWTSDSCPRHVPTEWVKIKVCNILDTK